MTCSELIIKPRSKCTIKQITSQEIFCVVQSALEHTQKSQYRCDCSGIPFWPCWAHLVVPSPGDKPRMCGEDMRLCDLTTTPSAAALAVGDTVGEVLHSRISCLLGIKVWDYHPAKHRDNDRKKSSMFQMPGVFQYKTSMWKCRYTSPCSVQAANFRKRHNHLHHNRYLSEFLIWNGHLQSVSIDLKLSTSAYLLQTSPCWSFARVN